MGIIFIHSHWTVTVGLAVVILLFDTQGQEARALIHSGVLPVVNILWLTG